MTRYNPEYEENTPRSDQTERERQCVSLSEAVCEVCLTHAIRKWTYLLHISSEDAKDCAQEFLIKAFCKSVEIHKRRENRTCNQRYIHECAKNHAIDYSDKLHQRNDSEVHFTSREWEELRHGSYPIDPVQELLRDEFWERMDGLAAYLTPSQHDLYWRYYRNGESTTDIAFSMKQSEQSVRQGLYRIRRRFNRIASYRRNLK